MSGEITTGARLGRFEIGSAVGSSGTAQRVYRAEMDPGESGARRVAFAALDAGEISPEDAARGFALSSGVEHPCLLVPIEYGILAERPYLATPWLDGVSLYEITQANAWGSPKASLRWIASIGLEIADVLSSIRAPEGAGEGQVLVLGRIAPTRVLLSKSGHVRMTLLALPPALAAAMGPVDSFSSPEQRAGSLPTPASDVYALARLLMWMWDRDPDPQRSLSGIRDTYPDLYEILSPALASDPAERHVDPRWLTAHLGRLLEPLGGPMSAADLRVLLAERQHEEITKHSEPVAPPRAERWAPSATTELLSMFGALAAGVALSISMWAVREPLEPRAPAVAAHAPAHATSAPAAPTPALPARIERAEAELQPSAPREPAPAVAEAEPQPSAPSAPSPRAGGPGSVSIRSRPDGVVYVDGKPLGTTPIDAHTLPTGAHTIEVRLGGHATASREVQIRSGSDQLLEFQLQREAAGLGTLTLRSNPPSVVYVDGKPIGTTPVADLSVAAGLRVVEWKLGGHATERREVSVGSGKSLNLDVTLSPAP